MSGPVFISKASAKNSRLKKEVERLTQENDLLRRELAIRFEEKEGRPCEVVFRRGQIEYQLTFPFDTQRVED